MLRIEKFKSKMGGAIGTKLWKYLMTDSNYVFHHSKISPKLKQIQYEVSITKYTQIQCL